MILNIYSHHKCTLFIFSDKILNTARVSNIYLLPPCKCLNIASFSVYFIFFVITFFSTIFFPRNMFPPSYLLTSLYHSNTVGFLDNTSPCNQTKTHRPLKTLFFIWNWWYFKKERTCIQNWHSTAVTDSCELCAERHQMCTFQEYG